MKTWIPIVIFLFCSRAAFAQMSGTYTVGGTNPDFHTLNEALGEVEWQGMSGPVIFNVRSGSYPGFTVTDFSENPGNDTLTIQAESLNADSVIIGQYVTLNQADHVCFHCMTFRSGPGQTVSEITIDQANHILFKNCRIINPYPAAFDSQEALVNMQFPWSGAIKYVNFIGCTIYSDHHTILFSGDQGNTYFVGDSITGDLSGWANAARKTYQQSVIILDTNFFEITNQYFYSNTIYCNKQLRIQGNFYDNVFHCNIMPIANVFYHNHFYGDVFLDAITYLTFVANTCDSSFETFYCNTSTIANNKFLGSIELNSDNESFYDNFIYGHMIIDMGPGQVIRQNNFGKDSHLDLWYCGGIIENNNIANLLLMQPTFSISNNNFFNTENSSVTDYGANAFFYDPQYVSDQDLHAKNPALIGKSTPRTTNYFLYDIDSVFRDRVATIGANEICLNFSSDTVLLKCNDSICLAACIFDSTVNYWSPGNFFTDSTASRPKVQVGGPVRFYLNNRNSGVTDSVFITVSPGIPIAHASYTRNDYTVQFHNSSACADSYLWDFGDSITSAAINPIHTYSRYGTFLCTLIATSSMGQDTTQLTVEIPNGVENYYIQGMKICPNPARDLVKIDVRAVSGPYDLEIYNETGIKVISLVSVKSQATINVSSLPRGIYLVRAVSANYHVCEKLVLE